MFPESGARASAPALAAGNTVVVKPSEETSATTVEFARIVTEECGLPPGVFNVVLGAGRSAGSALVSHPLVRKVAFTGSLRAGKEIGHIAADRILPLTLELGGKSPHIVFEDADLDKAAANAANIFTRNCGQICSSGTRLLVQDSIHDAFVAKLVDQVRMISVGPEADARSVPWRRKRSTKRSRAITSSPSRKARKRRSAASSRDERLKKGWFVTPTVYTGVHNDMRIAREEIFGPVMGVIRFKDEADAIRIANDSEYGLAAGLGPAT